MTLTYKGKTYHVVFELQNGARLTAGGFERIVTTTARVYTKVGSTLSEVATGVALKAEEDEENLLLGFELALGRALKVLTEDKLLRGLFMITLMLGADAGERRSA